MNTAVQHLQLKQFRQLVTIAATGSIRQAAEILSISQPALSRSIRTIEDSISVKLMNRGPRGVELTKFGQTLVDYGKQIEFSVRFAGEEIEELRGKKEGDIKLGIGPYEGVSVVHIAIDHLLKKRPDAQISVIENNFDVLTTALLDGEIDIMLGPSLVGKKTAGLKTEILAETEVVFAVRSEHPLAQLDNVSLENICEAEWVLPTPQTRVETFFDNFFINEGHAPPKGPIIMAPGPTAIALLKRRDLVTMISRELIQEELTSRKIKVLSVSNKSLTLPLQLTTREFGKLGPACRDMISVIRHVCCEMNN